MKPLKNKLVDRLPEAQTRGLTYDCDGMPAPTVGSFLVSVCKGRVPGTVYQVAEVRKVKSATWHNRYALRVFRCPELLPEVTIDFRFVVQVRGAVAYPLFWYSRKKTEKNLSN